VLYLASSLRRSMPEVSIDILDQGLNEDISVGACVQQVLATEADLYGLSFGTTQYAHTIAISRAILREKPGAFIVCGGPHASALPQETLADTSCHVVIDSEGEITFCDIVSALRNGRPLSEVPGCTWLDESSRIVSSGPRSFVRDIDDLPFPARDLVDMSRYTRTINNVRATTIITARGCPGKCIFCSQQMWRSSLRLRSVGNILAEVDEIYAKQGIRNILFLDDTLTVNRRRTIDLCAGLKERGVIWRGWTRATSMDDELAAVMADSGCMALCVGVESGSQRMLKNIKKGTSVAANRRAIAAIKRAGINARVSLMIGNPGETWKSIQETIDFVLETRPDDWILSVFVPVPGSEAYQQPEKFGIRFLHNGDRKDFYSSFFVVGGEMESGGVMEYESLPRAEILRMRDQVFETLMRECPPKLYSPMGIK
jgi:radical SAM superfamily enzyme YgiQ (UPF0313 family)